MSDMEAFEAACRACVTPGERATDESIAETYDALTRVAIEMGMPHRPKFFPRFGMMGIGILMADDTGEHKSFCVV